VRRQPRDGDYVYADVFKGVYQVIYKPFE